MRYKRIFKDIQYIQIVYMIKKKGTFHKRRVPLFCIWVMLYLDCKIYLPMYFLPFMMYI